MSRPVEFKTHRQKGFTLIEVLVALAVVSVALAALSRAMGLTVSNQAGLEERIVATWVAQDELVKMQVLPDSRPEAKQDVAFLNRNWTTEVKTEATLIPDIKKVTMTVTEEGQDRAATSLVTVVGP
ncbi:MAG: type II secretion system minor pseudopilin GspI [Pseudomonadota bacterium]|nr:type II secretion system minor pseudopilin GspI [Pseudomonadota bacterium]